MIETHTNGFTAVAPSTWRAAAMDAALRCAATDGTPEFLLAAHLQEQLPGQIVYHFCENRIRIRRALERVFAPLNEVLPPAFVHNHSSPRLPVHGWWQGTDATTGAHYEIVLSPGFYVNGDWLIVGPDRNALRSLVARLLESADSHGGRCLRYADGEWQEAPELETELQRITWDDIILAPELLSDIRRTIDTFFHQKAVFEQAGFAWRRGVLFVGPPGTGKTMLCKAAARAHPDIPFLYVRDIQSRGRDGIQTIFEKARKLAPCILAFEDMDGMIHESNRTQFLNELDGFQNNHGLLILASSNHPGKIDEALLRRPSRFDRVYHIGLPETAERAEYGRRLLERTVNLPAELDSAALATQVAATTDGFTPAFLKEVFLSALLHVVQEGKENSAEAFVAATQEQVESLRKYLKKAKDPTLLGEFAPSSLSGIGLRSR